jgi:hypothetical protein
MPLQALQNVRDLMNQHVGHQERHHIPFVTLDAVVEKDDVSALEWQRVGEGGGTQGWRSVVAQADQDA